MNNKKKYNISIEETVIGSFEIEANSLDEAKEKAIEEYKKGNFVLEPGELEEKKIQVIDKNKDEQSEWEEF